MRRLFSVETFLLIAGWLSIFAALVVMSYPFWRTDKTFDVLRDALPAGILIAIAGQLLTQWKNLRDARDRRSAFYLDSCVKAYEEARLLVADGNNNRPTWIAAARALGHAADLAMRISEEPHQRVLELHKLKYRRFFHEVLAGKSGGFFYGVDPQMSIDDAAKASTVPQGTTISTLQAIPEKALRSVWGAAQWPVQYADPMEREFSKEERGQLLLFQGLQEYLDHTERWHSVAGKLHERRSVERS